MLGVLNFHSTRRPQYRLPTNKQTQKFKRLLIRIQIGKQSHQQKDEDALHFDVGGANCGGAHFRDCFTLAFPMKGMKRNLKKGTFPTIWKNPLKHYQSGVDDRWVKLQCICAVLITIIFISPFTCDMIFSGIVVQYSCNECSDYLDFPYCCMCFHTFLLSSHSYSKTGICAEWTWSQFPNSQTFPLKRKI